MAVSSPAARWVRCDTDRGRNKQTSCPFRCGGKGWTSTSGRDNQPQVCRVACNHSPTPRRSRKFGPSRRREVGRERGENSTATLNRRTIHSHDRLDPIFLSLVEGGERFSSVARVCVYPLNGRAVNS